MVLTDGVCKSQNLKETKSFVSTYPLCQYLKVFAICRTQEKGPILSTQSSLLLCSAFQLPTSILMKFVSFLFFCEMKEMGTGRGFLLSSVCFSFFKSFAQPLSPLGLCLAFMLFELCSFSRFLLPSFHCVISIWSLLSGMLVINKS